MGINKQGYEAKMNEHQNQMQKGEFYNLPLLTNTDP